MKTTQRPTLKKDSRIGSVENKTYEHPAFAVMRISNPQGGNVTLFGSDALHDSRIRIEVAPATWDRHLSTDWIYGSQKPIVAVEMSHAQFVSAIQSSGKSEGTPVTLVVAPVDRTVERVAGIEPLESSHEMVKDEMVNSLREQLAKALAHADALSEAVENNAGKKSIREGINSLKNSLTSLPSSLDFSLDMAKEAIDKKKFDAQIEIDAMIENKVRQVGLEAIGANEQLLRLENKTGEN